MKRGDDRRTPTSRSARSLVCGALAATIWGSACTSSGHYYGGGDGLTLIATHSDGTTDRLSFPGASRHELRANWGGDYAFASVSEKGDWSVQVTDDFVFAADILEPLGIPCAPQVDLLHIAVRSEGVTLALEMAEETVVLGVTAPASGEGLAGSTDGEVIYGGDAPWDSDGCAADASVSVLSELQAVWAFSPRVRHRNRCFGCGSLDVDLNLNL